MESLIHDLRVSLRSLFSRPAFAAAGILTLALGIGATTTVFSIVFGVLIRPLPYPESQQLLTVWQTDARNPSTAQDGGASPLNDDDWRKARTLEAVALYSGANVVINEGNDPQAVRAGMVTRDFFRTFGVSPVLGREFTEEEDRPNGPAVAIISYGLWQEKFGSVPDVIGKTINVFARPRLIVGVAPRNFSFPEEARLWLPVQNNDENCARDCYYLAGVARMKPGIPAEVAQQELKVLAQQVVKAEPQANPNLTFMAATLRDSIVGPVTRPLYILFGAILMVLLIACANVANLMLVRGSGRAGEIAVRAALGASRGRLVRQLLTESVVLALLGTGLGLLLANWALYGVIALSPGNLPRLTEVTLGWPAVFFSLGLTVLTAAVFGLVPAIQISRVTLAKAIRQGGRGDTGPGRGFGRSLLLAGEVGFSVLLLLGAGLLIRSFIEIQSVKLGFEPEGVAQFRLTLPSIRYDSPEKTLQLYEQFRERLKSHREIEAVSFVTAPPLGESEWKTAFRRLDRPEPKPGEGNVMIMRVVDPEYLAVTKIPLVSGRNFVPSDRHGSLPVALVTRAAAEKFWPGEDVIGKQIKTGVSMGYPSPDAMTIIGVVDDVRGSNITTKPEPEVYFAQSQSADDGAFVLIRTRGDVETVLNIARSELRALDSGLPMIRAGAMTDFVNKRMATPRFYMMLLASFAVLAVILAAIGIYGVVAYIVAQRTREIGVRIALGAGVANVIRLVLWQGFKPALLGVALGTAAALNIGDVMNKLLYEVGARDPITFVAVPVVVLLTVIAACVLPARRAGQTSPAIALRSEQL